MKAEKVTINLSTVELAQIDFLVEKGLYASRSDFIRLATRKQTEEHKGEIENFVDPKSSSVLLGSILCEKDLQVWSLGVAYIGAEEVEHVFLNEGIIDLRIIGVLKVGKDVDPVQFKKVLKRAKINGKVSATPEIKTIIDELNQ